MTSVRQELKELHEEIKKESFRYTMPSKGGTLSHFLSESLDSVRFIFEEKENIIFALLQLLVIVVVYLLWAQIIWWIPPEVWDKISSKDYNHMLDVIFFVWSFMCVGLAAYPIFILTACMSASYTLYSQGKESTFLKCLRIALSRAWTLWVFGWMDGWITANRWLERLGKQNLTSHVRESVYQLWKIVTLGIVPSLVFGRDIVTACRESQDLLRRKFAPLAWLRVGYSFACLIAASVCPILGAIFLWKYVGNFVNINELPDIYAVYILCSVLLFVVLFAIMIILRPVYIIAATRIYIDYAEEQRLEYIAPTDSPRWLSSLVCLFILFILIMLIVLLRDQMGISAILTAG